MEGSLGSNLEAETEADSVEKRCLLACSQANMVEAFSQRQVPLK